MAHGSNSGGERPWCVLGLSDVEHEVAGVEVRSLPCRVGRGMSSDVAGWDVLAEEAQCILRLGAGGHLEMEEVSGIPLLLNGETVCGGERLCLGEGDLVAVFPRDLEFTVRDLRVEADGVEGGEDTRGSIAGDTINAPMECSLCNAAVLPTVPHTTSLPVLFQFAVLRQHRCSRL